MQIRATLLAKYCLDCQPESVRRRLIRNEPFGARLGLETRTIATVADLARFDREDLLAAARAALSGSGESVVEDVEGISAVVAREQNGLVLKRAGQGEPIVAARLDNLMIVSSSREERSAGLASLLNRAGPTAPDFSSLQRAAEERDLSNEEAGSVLDELADGVAALRARAAKALEAADEAATDNLIPPTMTYYDRFCGPDPSGADAEAYLTMTLPAYRRGLLGRDLVRGLEICLLGALRDDLSPGTWAEDVSDDALWKALTECNPHSNPHSLLGALDIALSRQHDSRYRSFAEDAVEKLTGTTFPRPDGINAHELLPLFARIVFGKVTMIEGGASRPPYWRRMCAWMQAGWLARITLPLVLEMTQLRGWAAANETAAMTYARMLDLRWEPMSQASEMSPLSLRCELVGRLHLLRSRHEAAGRSFPSAGKVDAAMEQLGEQGAPLGWALPGLMEGHRQPCQPLPADSTQQMIAAFSARPDTSAWMRLAYLSQLFTFGPDLMQCLWPAARGIVLDGQQIQREQGFVQLERACSIAAARRDTQLARAIGTVLLEHTPKSSTGQEAAAVLAVSILAAAAFEHEAEWAVWLEEQLAATAIRLPAGEPIEAFGAQLEALKEVLPLRHAIQARAEALCAAAV